VRTQAEWDYVGHIPESVLIEWNTYPKRQRNPRFLEQLQARVAKTEAPVMFLCRSGARSHHAAAAATQAGYPNSYNVLEDFEGEKDPRPRWYGSAAGDLPAYPGSRLTYAKARSALPRLSADQLTTPRRP